MASAGRSTEQLRQAQDVDAIPTLASSVRPGGSADLLNRRWLDYTGFSPDEASDWGWTAALHTEGRDPAARNPSHLSVIGTRSSTAAELQQSTANQNSDP
jgi:hypothetical protein